MIEYLALGLAWLLLPLPFAVLVGKCISQGQPEDEPAWPCAAVDVADVPAQRQPAALAATSAEAATSAGR